MIRAFILALLALALGAYLAILLINDPGNLVITFQGYYLQTTLVFAVLALAAVFILLLLCFRCLKLAAYLFRRRS